MSDSSPILFIADLHLSDQSPDIYQRFKEFIGTKALNSRALYILGDLFEYYLGDDAMSPLCLQVCEDLKKLNQNHGVETYFLHGNRDFLVGGQFESKSRTKILSDPYLLELNTETIILTHSDQLCTDDIPYQKARTQLRDPQWQQWFLNLSIEERVEFAKKARKQSKEHTQKASQEIMDVNSTEVQKLFESFQLKTLLHGHTHRPAFHYHQHYNQDYLRMVLGDWHHQSSYIEYQNGTFKLLTC